MSSAQYVNANVYEPVDYGREDRAASRKKPVSNENIVLRETSKEEKRKVLGHEVQEKKSSGTVKASIKVVVLFFIVIVLLAVSVTALVVSIYQPFKDQPTRSEEMQQLEAMQMEIEIEKNFTLQLIQSLQREFEVQIAAINISVQMANYTVTQNDHRIEEVETRVATINNTMAQNYQQLDDVKEEVTAIKTSVQTVNNTVVQSCLKINEVETRLARVNNSLQAASSVATQRINSVETKLDAFNASLPMMNNAITQNNQNIERVETRTSAVNSSVLTIESFVNWCSRKTDRFQTLVTALNTSVLTMTNRFQELRQNVSNYHPQGVNCSSNEYLFNPHTKTCYRIVYSHMSWTNARGYCAASGEFLATFSNPESMLWLRTLLATAATSAWHQCLYVGGYKFTAGWRWTGRVTSPVNSAAWAPGEPNSQRCMCAWSDSRDVYQKFYDARCSVSRYFICETA